VVNRERADLGVKNAVVRFSGRRVRQNQRQARRSDQEEACSPFSGGGDFTGYDCVLS
jgi:hypothetical protein